MRREVAIAAVAAIAVFAALGATLAPHAVAAPAPSSVVFEPVDASFEEAALATCEDFGFFAADKKKECDESCKRGRKCQKKQVCGEGPCPDPGYCWKCG